MMPSRKIKSNRPSVVCLGLSVLLMILIGGTANSQTTVDRGERSYKAWVQGGYFTPARSNMRSIYGGALNIAGGVEKRISSKLSAGVYGGFLEQDKGSIQLKYRNMYIVPAVTLWLFENERAGLHSQF